MDESEGPTFVEALQSAVTVALWFGADADGLADLLIALRAANVGKRGMIKSVLEFASAGTDGGTR